MASLNLKIEDFCDPASMPAEPRTTTPAPKTESENQSFAYKDVGGTGYSDSKVFLILRDFLQPDTTKSLAFTVESILDLLPKNAPMSNEVCSAGEVCLELAEQIPYHHPSQIKLARVVEELSRSAKVTQPPDQKGMHFRFFRFKESLRDAYTGPDEDNPAAWPNLHAFFAHEQDSHVRPPSPLFAIWAMREAFEYHPKNEKKPFNGLQDQKVLAAAQHILWNGQGLFKQVMYPGDVPSNGVPVPSWNAGPLYKGKPVLSLDRWQFWRKGFEASAGDSSLAEECRNVARKVANLMESLEQSMMF